MKQIVKRGALGLAAALVLAQLIPIRRTNPPVETLVPVSKELEAVMRRSCFDCSGSRTWISSGKIIDWRPRTRN